MAQCWWNVKRESGSSFRVPFIVLVDGREKTPYRFRGLRADAKLRGIPLDVPTQWAHLPSGDYSIEGCKHLVAVERKSLVDCYSTLGQHRDRFEAEVLRLSKLDSAAIVIEAPWAAILNSPPPRSRLRPKTVWRTMIAWTQRYRVPWIACEDRALAEAFTFRWLERWWYDVQEWLGESNDNCRVCGAPLRAHRSRARGLGPLCAARGDRALAMTMQKGRSEGMNGSAEDVEDQFVYLKEELAAREAEVNVQMALGMEHLTRAEAAEAQRDQLRGEVEQCKMKLEEEIAAREREVAGWQQESERLKAKEADYLKRYQEYEDERTKNHAEVLQLRGERDSLRQLNEVMLNEKDVRRIVGAELVKVYGPAGEEIIKANAELRALLVSHADDLLAEVEAMRLENMRILSDPEKNSGRVAELMKELSATAEVASRMATEVDALRAKLEGVCRVEHCWTSGKYSAPGCQFCGIDKPADPAGE